MKLSEIGKWPSQLSARHYFVKTPEWSVKLEKGATSHKKHAIVFTVITPDEYEFDICDKGFDVVQKKYNLKIRNDILNGDNWTGYYEFDGTISISSFRNELEQAITKQAEKKNKGLDEDED
jgi:hypothetical protein